MARASASPVSLLAASSGRTSRISCTAHSTIDPLLDAANRIVVMNPRCALGGPDDACDLLVRHPLVHSQHEYLALQRRQLLDRLHDQLFSLAGDYRIKRRK